MNQCAFYSLLFGTIAFVTPFYGFRSVHLLLSDVTGNKTVAIQWLILRVARPAIDQSNMNWIEVKKIVFRRFFRNSNIWIVRVRATGS